MRPRSFVFLTIGGISAVFAATVAANLLIDPQGMFGSTLVPDHFNPNVRYRVLQAYAQSPAKYDAVVFGSSRANAFHLDVLAERLGVRAVAKFAVPFGLLPDHLPTLEYLIRDKAQRGERLKALFLVLDADFFGQRPWTNNNIDSFQPPQISGEQPARFWWRYLTVFQFRNWRGDLRDALRGRTLGPGNPGLALRAPVTLRPDLARQLSMLQRLIGLCREHQIRCLVIMSPLSRTNVRRLDGAELDRIVQEIARITPVWDFGRPEWLPDRPEYWQDPSHYSEGVASMIVDRVFGEPSASNDFGRLLGAPLSP